LAPEILARDISARTFHQQDILAHASLGPVDILAHGHFISMDVLTQGIFGTMEISPWDISAPEDFRTWMFFCLGKQYGHFGRDIVAPVRLCQNDNVPKFSCA
jgi:hypothetical protein